MRKLFIPLLITVWALALSPAQAKQSYAGYEGANSVQVGTGRDQAD
jgi:hypothetical protein